MRRDRLIMSSVLDIFDYRRGIATLLSNSESDEVFDKFCKLVLDYYARPVGSLTELKKRDLKQSVGTMWEYFCVDWLKNQRDKNDTPIYDNVWTLREWHDYCDKNDVQKGLILGKRDIGIDLVAHSASGYHAVQCKWKNKGKVTWAQLSTFIGLVARSGPWSSHIIMTSGTGILWKVRRSEKDKSLCKGTFSKTTRAMWLSISGVSGVGHRLTDDAPSEPPTPPIPTVLDRMREARLSQATRGSVDLDKVREARLARFTQSSAPE